MRAQTYLLSFLLIGTLFLAACGQGIDDPLNWETEEFTFTDHNNEEFGSSDLEGKVWLADFVFTNCTTVCLPMMANMKGVQEELQAQGLDVEIVSFSVDPTVDTPETLKSYAESYDVDLTSWHLLTGYSQEEIADFALENFKAIAQKPQDDDQVIHGTSFYLIDHEGVIMKDYDGLNPPVEDIVRDAEILVEEAEG